MSAVSASDTSRFFFRFFFFSSSFSGTRCTTTDVKRATSQLRVDREAWRAVDETTWYAEQSDTLNGVRKVRVAVAHVFRTADGEHGVAFAQFDGPPSKRGELLKIINSIRANTPR